MSSASSVSSGHGRNSRPSSISSVGSSGLTGHYPLCGTYEQLTPATVIVDTLNGDILPSDTFIGSLANPPENDDGRYQRFLSAGNASANGPRSPTLTASRPQYEHQTERRTIMIRDLDYNVTEWRLQEFLETHDLAEHLERELKKFDRTRICSALVKFPTGSGARNAVEKLDECHFMGRKLRVELAPESDTVRHQPGLHWDLPRQAHNPRRPIIADGSI